MASARTCSRLPIGFIRQIGRITGAEYPIRDKCEPAAYAVGVDETSRLTVQPSRDPRDRIGSLAPS